MSAERETIIRYRLERAHGALREARDLAGLGHWNLCASRLYYACFYAAIALLLRRGLSSSKHTGVRSFFNRYIVHRGAVSAELGDLYNDLFDLRQEADYQEFVKLDEATVQPLIRSVEEFIAAIEALLASDARSPEA